MKAQKTINTIISGVSDMAEGFYVAPRHPVLRSLIGNHTINTQLTSDEIPPYIYDALISQPVSIDQILRGSLPKDKHNREVRLGKYLSIHQIDQKIISEFVNKIKTGHELNLNFSGRTKDFLRCSKTKHFDSCYAFEAGYGWQRSRLVLLRSPNFLVINRRDKSGNFDIRLFLRKIKDALIIQTLYSNIGSMSNKLALVSGLLEYLRKKVKELNLPIKTVGFSTKHSNWCNIKNYNYKLINIPKTDMWMYKYQNFYDDCCRLHDVQKIIYVENF